MTIKPNNDDWIYRDGHWQERETKVDESIGLIFRWIAQLSSHFGTERAIFAIIPEINDVIRYHNLIDSKNSSYILRPGHWTENQYRFSLTLFSDRKYAEVSPDILKNLEFHTHRESL